MEKIILLTKHYPFDYGEEFIENEINFISKNFDEVYIFATSVISCTQIRKTPLNVKAFPIKETKSSLLRYVKYIFSSFLKSNVQKKVELKRSKKVIEKLAVRYVFGRSIRNSNKIYINLNNLIKKDDNIVFYSYWFGDLTLSSVSLANKIQYNMNAIVSRAHGYDLYSDRNISKIIPFAEYLLSNIDMLLPCSDNGTKYAISKWNYKSNTIKTSYLGTLDYGYKQPIKDIPFVLLTCSSIDNVKRLNLIAEALFKVSDVVDSKLKWICIGDGPKLEELKNYVNLNLTNIDVEFTGRLSNQDVMKIYQNTNINLFVNTSISEGLPVSVMEASSFGIPILATDVGGTREIVLDGITGFLLNVDSSTDIIAKKIVEFVNMPIEKYNNMCCKSRANWLNKFNANINYSLFTKELKSLICDV